MTIGVAFTSLCVGVSNDYLSIHSWLKVEGLLIITYISHFRIQILPGYFSPACITHHAFSVSRLVFSRQSEKFFHFINKPVNLQSEKNIPPFSK